MICLKKASTNINNDRKGEASCLGTSKLLLVDGELDIVAGAIGVLLLLCSNVSGYIKQRGEIKARVSI